MNFLINIRVFIKTLNELLLIHLIGSDHVRYEYFSMLGYDMQRDFYFDGQKRSYYESRYKMIEGDDKFNSEQKERIEFLLSHHNSMTSMGMGYATYGGSVVVGGGRTHTASGKYSTIAGGFSNSSTAIGGSSNIATGGSQVLVQPGTYNVTNTSTTTKTIIPIK